MRSLLQRLLRGASSAVALLVLFGCAGEPDGERAEALVRRYNEKLIDAFRAGDPDAMEGVAGPDEAKKILGLIGVKSDQGITLDATLHELRVTGVERSGADVLVTTEERWSYRDRKIGSGAQVGEASQDHYFMRYTLSQVDGLRVVAKVEFAQPPQVGRTKVPDSAPTGALHGVDTHEPGATP